MPVRFSTPVLPMKTMFSACWTKSREAKALIWRRLTPGCCANGKVSREKASGRAAFLMRQARAFSCWSCH